jgi:hypothetical protein
MLKTDPYVFSRIKHYIESHVDIKTLFPALIIFVVVSFLFMGLENTLFWIEVGKVRRRIGGDSSFEIGKNMVTSTKILFLDFFFRIPSYGIPSYVAARKTKMGLPYSPLVVGLVLVIISTSWNLVYNPRTFYDYPILFLLETAFSLGISVAAGMLGKQKRRRISSRREAEMTGDGLSKD